MGNKNAVYLTQQGLDDLKKELDDLINVRRPENIQAIKEARSLGDLSENAEYDAARDEQRDMEARIAEIENILKAVEIVDKEDVKKGVVAVGSHVKIRYIKEKDEIEYDIVGATEANSLEKKISCESPLGKILMGKKKGDIVELVVGNNKIKIEILKVS